MLYEQIQDTSSFNWEVGPQKRFIEFELSFIGVIREVSAGVPHARFLASFDQGLILFWSVGLLQVLPLD